MTTPVVIIPALWPPPVCTSCEGALAFDLSRWFYQPECNRAMWVDVPRSICQECGLKHFSSVARDVWEAGIYSYSRYDDTQTFASAADYIARFGADHPAKDLVETTLFGTMGVDEVFCDQFGYNVFGRKAGVICCPVALEIDGA